MSTLQYSILIDLRWCLDELLADRVIDQCGYNVVMISRRHKAQHPLITIREFNLPNAYNASIAKADGSTGNIKNRLNLLWLNQWLAVKANILSVRIDPLRIDVPAVPKLIPFEYAHTQPILTIEVSKDEVLIGMDHPFYNDWHLNMSKVIK